MNFDLHWQAPASAPNHFKFNMWNPIHLYWQTLLLCGDGSRVPIGYCDATMTTTAIIFDFCCVRLHPPLISVFRGNNWLSPNYRQWSTQRIVEDCIHCIAMSASWSLAWPESIFRSAHSFSAFVCWCERTGLDSHSGEHPVEGKTKAGCNVENMLSICSKLVSLWREVPRTASERKMTSKRLWARSILIACHVLRTFCRSNNASFSLLHHSIDYYYMPAMRMVCGTTPTFRVVIYRIHVISDANHALISQVLFTRLLARKTDDVRQNGTISMKRFAWPAQNTHRQTENSQEKSEPKMFLQAFLQSSSD